MKGSKHFDFIIIGFLSVSLIFLIFLAFFKTNSIDLEIIKSGGIENFELVKKLYTNPSYISEQKTSIKQGLDSFGIK